MKRLLPFLLVLFACSAIGQVTTTPSVTGVPAPQSAVAITGGTISGVTITSSTYNGNTWTAGTATLTGAAGKTLTWNDIITLSSDGTGTRTLNVGTGGTLGTAAYTAATAYATSTQGTTADAAMPKAGGTFTGNILFTDASYDIGATGATRPRDIFLSRNATIGGLTATRVPFSGTGGLLSDSSALTFNSGTGALSATTFVGALTGTASGNLTSAANSIALGNIAQIATNTVAGNSTSGTADIAALAVGSCSTSSSALIWTTNTGFGCNTAIAASTATSATTAGTVTTAAQPSITSVGTLTSLAVTGAVTGSGFRSTSAISSPGDASFYRSASTGTTIQAIAGSSYDFALINPGNNLYIARNPTGTQNVELLGTLNVATFNDGTGLFVCESSGLLLSGTTTCVASARKFKDEIGVLPLEQSDRLDLLQASIYTYKDPDRHGKGERVGLYAEDVEKMDSRCAEYDASGALQTYDDRCVLAYVVADRQAMKTALQEQREQIAELKSMVKDQQAMLDALPQFRHASGIYLYTDADAANHDQFLRSVSK